MADKKPFLHLLKPSAVSTPAAVEPASPSDAEAPPTRTVEPVKLSDELRPEEVVALVNASQDPEEYLVIETSVDPRATQIGLLENGVVLVRLDVLFKPGTLTAFQSRLMTPQGALVNQFKIRLPALVRFVMHQDEVTSKAREELFKALQAKTLKKET